MDKSKSVAVAAKAIQEPKFSWTLTSIEELEQFRKEEGLSKAELCRQIGISQGAYRNWELGRNIAKYSTQERIVAYLNGNEPTSSENHITISKNKLQAAKDILFQKPANDQLELSAMSATADIVKTYLQHSDRLKPDQLVKLVGRVQEALLGNF
jgi:transcriptional regulator with XRE-family HTH domain